MRSVLESFTRRRVSAAVALATAAFVLVPAAGAGGSFERIVGVGANGTWASLKLNQTGPRSDAVLRGRAVGVPPGGYVRIYPLIGGLPAIPGRFYPAAHVLCLYWHEPASNCLRLGSAGDRLLAPFTDLPLRRRAPTAPVAVRYRSRLLHYADGNILAALELALERHAQARPTRPHDAIALTVSWGGPDAVSRPRHLFLSPVGVYAGTRLFPLQRGPWCYLAENLPAPSSSVIEATARLCR